MDKKTEFYTNEVMKLLKNQGYEVEKIKDTEPQEFEIIHKDDSSVFFLSVLWRPGGKLLKKDLKLLDGGITNILVLVDDTNKKDIKYTAWFDSGGGYMLEDDKPEDDVLDLDEAEYIRGKPESMSLTDWLKSEAVRRAELLAFIELMEKLKISADTLQNRLYSKQVADMFLRRGFRIKKVEQDYPFFEVVGKTFGDCLFSVLWRPGGKLVPEDMDYMGVSNNLVLVDDADINNIKFRVWFNKAWLDVVDDNATDEDLRKMDDWKSYRKNLVSVSLKEWMKSSALELQKKFDN